MATVNVLTGSVVVKALPLTVKVFKQIPIVQWAQIKDMLKEDGGIKPTAMPEQAGPRKFLGWIHGSGVGTEPNDRWLIVEMGDGKYGRFLAMFETVRGVQQIYVA